MDLMATLGEDLILAGTLDDIENGRNEATVLAWRLNDFIRRAIQLHPICDPRDLSAVKWPLCTGPHRRVMIDVLHSACIRIRRQVLGR